MRIETVIMQSHRTDMYANEQTRRQLPVMLMTNFRLYKSRFGNGEFTEYRGRHEYRLDPQLEWPSA